MENNYNNNNGNGNGPTVVAVQGGEQKKSYKWLWIGGAGVAAIILINRSQSLGNSKDLSESQKDILLKAGAGDPGQLTLQPKDNSPQILTTGDSSMPYEQLESLVDEYYSRYAVTCGKIAAKMQTDAESVFANVAILFGELPAGKVITEKSLDGYFKTMEIWSGRFDSALGVVSNAITNILATQIAGIEKGKKCTKWVYIRSNDVTQTESTTKTAVVKNTNKANNGFIGLVGKKKTSLSETMNSSTVTQTYNEKITFIPHCESYQLDPIVVLSVLNASSVSVALQYDLLSGVMAMAPKPENFLTNVPGNV